MRQALVTYHNSGTQAHDRSSSVFHASELSLLFGPVPNAIEDDFANQFTDFYINFVTDLDPGCKHVQLKTSFTPTDIPFLKAEWPQFDPINRHVLQLMRNNITIIPDGSFPKHSFSLRAPLTPSYFHFSRL